MMRRLIERLRHLRRRLKRVLGLIALDARVAAQAARRRRAPRGSVGEAALKALAEHGIEVETSTLADSWPRLVAGRFVLRSNGHWHERDGPGRGFGVFSLIEAVNARGLSVRAQSPQAAEKAAAD